MWHAEIRLLTLLVLLAPAALSAAPLGGEAGLWAIWSRHASNTFDHAGVAAACAAFREKAPQDPLGVVTRGLEAWHRLRQGETNAAVALFEQMVVPTGQAAVPGTGDPLVEAGTDMARAWLSRLDRERVKAALQELYRKQIEYPASLDALRRLPDSRRLPLTDRWGLPWSYRLAPFSRIPGLKGQRYQLESQALKANSSLAEALARPYSQEIRLDPARFLSAAAGRESLEFALGTNRQDKAILSLGGKNGRTSFAFCGQQLIVLADSDHWKIALRPR